MMNDINKTIDNLSLGNKQEDRTIPYREVNQTDTHHVYHSILQLRESV